MALMQRIRNVFAGDRVRRDVERELAFHISERASELQAGGMSREEALYTARRQFGSLAQQVDDTRDANIAMALEGTLRNFRLAFRTLAKSPVLAITVILTLGLGIGANSAVFSAINAVLLKPLPFPEADRLVAVRQVQANNPPYVGPPRLADWSRLNSTLSGLTGFYTQDESELSGELPEKLRRAYVAPRFLEVWGVPPRYGRDFLPHEEKFGGPGALIISDRLARRRFHNPAEAIGKRLRFGTSAVSIVGVMPASFLFPDREVDMWSPSPMDAPYAQSRESTWFNAIGRLKPGVTIEQAHANLNAVQAGLARQFPKTDGKLAADVRPLKESFVGGMRRSLWVLYGSVSLLLLIACTNVAALLLSRAMQRQHEVALRFSLGASRSSIVLQLLTETCVLAFAGALLGLVIAMSVSRVIQNLAASLPRVEEIALDWRIVAYTMVSAVAATLISGLVPALRGSRRSLAGSIAHTGRGQVSSRSRIQLLLVGVQVALAVTLLAGAGLLLRSFIELSRVTPGFDATNVLTFNITASWAETSDRGAAKQRTRRIIEGLRTVPGVESAASSLVAPGVPTQFPLDIQIVEGLTDPESKIAAEGRLISTEYFATMRIPLIAGELCADNPQSSGVIVNRSFVSTHLAGSNGIGLHLRLAGLNRGTPYVIRGVVGDARETGLDRQPVPTVYTCYDMMQPGLYFLVRTQNDPLTMVETLRRKLLEIEPRRSIYNIMPAEERIGKAFAANRLRTFLLAFFAFTALSLASVGLYGTLSYVVNVRKREVGLRLALGALQRQIVTHFVTQGIAVAAAGCVVGLVLALSMSRLIAGMLYGVTSSDALTLTVVILTVLIVATLASLLPALRAARLEPVQVLRSE